MKTRPECASVACGNASKSASLAPPGIRLPDRELETQRTDNPAH